MIALAVARQESGFRVYANDGLGDDLGPDQAGIATSLSLPHDAVGTDHGSLGIFQQQWPWWGPMSDLMNPATSAGLFYQALLAVPGWQSMAPGVAAQTVQRSAHPTAYDDDVAFAVDLYAVLADPGTGVASAAQNGACRPGSSTGTVTAAGTEGIVLPVPANSGAVDLRNWGGGGPHWSSWHTGTDFSVACGTPVVAANAGTVDIDTTESWAGPWLVKISRGPGDLTTWYAHMERVTVTDGQHVDAGSTLGAVGAEGNATGCHLHFEVHITGGDIYGPDNVNPSTWLEQVSAGGLSAGGLSAGGVSARGPVVAAG